ncbi:MAG: Lrp/AsnC family transcriptional regulator [Candidatus Bathyarchaeia archaeon]
MGLRIKLAEKKLKLDEIDRKILNLLQEDARRSFKDMAQRAGVSEATVFVRVRKLVKNGVIKAFKAILDPAIVGKGTLAFIMVKANPSEYTNVLQKLKDMRDVYEIYDVTGPNYAILKVRTESPERLAELIDQVGAIRGVESTETSMVLRNVKEELSLKL